MEIVANKNQFKDIVSDLDRSAYRIFIGEENNIVELYPATTSRNRIKVVCEASDPAITDDLYDWASDNGFNVYKGGKVFPRERVPKETK